MTNSVDPDQTPRCAASDLGPHCSKLRVITVFFTLSLNFRHTLLRFEKSVLLIVDEAGC